LTDFEAHEAEAMYYQLDREALAELAELWDPNIPIQSNKAYMKRARELNKELETALLAQKTRE
jgi:CPA2 family monovalent cation:H+ antiporter-2